MRERKKRFSEIFKKIAALLVSLSLTASPVLAEAAKETETLTEAAKEYWVSRREETCPDRNMTYLQAPSVRSLHISITMNCASCWIIFTV